jgi:hypothetical protein
LKKIETSKMALFCKTKASLLVFFCLLWSGAPPHHEESSDDHPTFCGTPSDDPGELRNIQKTRFGGGSRDRRRAYRRVSASFWPYLRV